MVSRLCHDGERAPTAEEGDRGGFEDDDDSDDSSDEAVTADTLDTDRPKDPALDADTSGHLGVGRHSAPSTRP